MEKKFIAIMTLSIFVIILTLSTAQIPPTNSNTPGQIQAPINQVPTIQHPDLVVIPEKAGDLNLGDKAIELDKTNKEKIKIQNDLNLANCLKTMSKIDCESLLKK